MQNAEWGTLNERGARTRLREASARQDLERGKGNIEYRTLNVEGDSYKFI
jgi:hypothetical protein